MNDNIGKIIKKYRKMNNMTQKELANLIHVEHSTISNWELGKRKVDIETARELSQILGFSLDDDSEVKSNNLIYQSIEYRNFKSEIQKKYMMVKLLFIILFINFSATIFGGNINFISIFAVVYIIFILYDVLLLFKPKVDIDHYNISQNKTVFLEKNIKNDKFKKDYIKRLINMISYYIALMIILSLSHAFLYPIDHSVSYIFVSSILVFSGLFIFFIIREVRFWRMKKSFDYKKFQYKNDLFIYRLMIVIFDFLILYTLATTSFYLDAISSNLVIYFLYMFSFYYYGVGYDLYIRKLNYLSDFSLKY
jgi:transcriptional regulator with XRE-family HTH domain